MTVLRSAADPVVTGQAVTYTATVRPAPHDGGVRFLVDGRAMAGCRAVTTDQQGTAVCHDVHRAAGEKIVQAVYHGDGRFARSVSNELIEVVDWSLRLHGRPSITGGAVTAILELRLEITRLPRRRDADGQRHCPRTDPGTCPRCAPNGYDRRRLDGRADPSRSHEKAPGTA